MVAIIKAEDIVLLRILEMKVKETVMVLVMVVVMMIIVDVREILCVAAIIARSLDITIMKRMIAVRNQSQVSIFSKCTDLNNFAYFKPLVIMQ